MTLDRLAEIRVIPYDREAALRGGQALADYLLKLVQFLQDGVNYEERRTINALLSIQNTGVIYLGSDEGDGTYPDGTWRIYVDSGNVLLQQVSSDVWTTYFTMTTTYVGSPKILISGATASRLLATDSDKYSVSVANLASWVAGTSNRVTVTNDGDGTITLSAPQDLHTGASPTFAGETLTGFSGIVKATTGVLGSGATLDDVAEGTSYKRVSATNYTDLTDAGDSTLHYHSSDRNRANHSGTQAASTISDFDTEVSNNTDVAANTSARHAAATVGGAPLTLAGQQVTFNYDTNDFQLSGNNLQVKDGGIAHSGLAGTHNLTTDIDHDALTNFVSAEHASHAAAKSGSVSFTDGTARAHVVTIGAGGIITSWTIDAAEVLT